MAQGQIKTKKSSAVSSRRPTVLGPKKGSRTIAPKKAALVKKQKMAKKFSAGLTAKTERNLAEKAGHLEMLAGGKKERQSQKAGGKKEHRNVKR